jgi:hypothetical protein
MSYKPIDRTKVRTKELLLDDGNAYNIYQDPFNVACQKIWKDMEEYEVKGYVAPEAREATRIRLSPN